MLKYRLEKSTPWEIIKALENSFNMFPVVTRDCVKALNTLIYNLQGAEMDAASLREIIFLILRGFTTSDNYLKNYMHTVLIELARKSRDGILSINCTVKDLDNGKTPATMKNAALRSLFSNLPVPMHYDFEKYVRANILDGQNSGVVLAAEYFKDSKIPLRVSGTIANYHQAHFKRLPINKYSSMLEMAHIAKSNPEEISSFLFISTDVTVFFEAAKTLRHMRPEIAAPFVDKAIHVLRAYAKVPGIESLCAMKVLSDLSASFPSKVAKANREIEDLVRSSYKCISMLAIVTLLRTGTGDTVDKLAAKLEPYMQSMTHGYKRMAIDTMERLFTKCKTASSASYLNFLKKALADKGNLNFKKYLLQKFDSFLRLSENRYPVVKFLCGYLEDPEYYQISIEILGILGSYLEDAKDLVHVYNRLIIDNPHVRKAALQTLFDVAEKATNCYSLDSVIESFKDQETQRTCDFLLSSQKLNRGPFNIDELGNLKEDVMKYLDEAAEEEIVEEGGQGFIKDCRKIYLTASADDFSISVTKKIFSEEIVLEFAFENKMKMVQLRRGLLTLEVEGEKYSLEVEDGLFADGVAVKELVVHAKEEDVVNGLFEYQVSLDEDIENDSISLEPFNFSLFDFVRPVPFTQYPLLKKRIELSLDCRPPEAASKIIDITNMHLVAEKANFSLSGTYNGNLIVIEANMSYSKITTMAMEVFCDSQEIIDRAIAIFE